MYKHTAVCLRILQHPLWMFCIGMAAGMSMTAPGAILNGYFLRSRQAASPITGVRFVTQVFRDLESPLINEIETVPAFGTAVFPVERAPNWGAMRTPAQWNRTYAQMADADFVPVPSYGLSLSDIPIRNLLGRRTEQIPILTAKLFYSTRFMGTYDLDAGEFTGIHAGIDLKLPMGTPIRSIGGGRVAGVRNDEILGLHVLIEHIHPTHGSIVSIYAHLDTANVSVGDAVTAGKQLGTVGMTGNTGAPHLHLQIDRTRDAANHIVYQPLSAPSRTSAQRRTINPMELIEGVRY